MESYNSEERRKGVGDDAPQAASQVNAHDNSNTPVNGSRQTHHSQNNQWSLWEHWQRATKAKRVEWMLKSFGGLIALLGLFSYFWGNFLTKSNFEADQRPYVSIVRGYPLEVRVLNASFGTFLATAIPIKNTGKSPASHVLVAGEILSGSNLDELARDWFIKMGKPLKTQFDKVRNLYSIQNGLEIPEVTLIQGDPPANAAAEDIEGMNGLHPPPSPPVAVAMRIEYRDNAANFYWTDLCWYVSQTQGEQRNHQLWVPCSGYPNVH